MAPNYGAVRRDDLARRIGNPLAQEIRQRNLADEANPHRLFFFRRRESAPARFFAHLGLGQVTNGKQRPRQEFLRQAAQKIGLVFFWVGGLE